MIFLQKHKYASFTGNLSACVNAVFKPSVEDAALLHNLRYIHRGNTWMSLEFDVLSCRCLCCMANSVRLGTKSMYGIFTTIRL